METNYSRVAEYIKLAEESVNPKLQVIIDLFVKKGGNIRNPHGNFVEMNGITVELSKDESIVFLTSPVNPAVQQVPYDELVKSLQ